MDRLDQGSTGWDQATYWQRHVEAPDVQPAQPASTATPIPPAEPVQETTEQETAEMAVPLPRSRRVPLAIKVVVAVTGVLLVAAIVADSFGRSSTAGQAPPPGRWGCLNAVDRRDRAAQRIAGCGLAIRRCPGCPEFDPIPDPQSSRAPARPPAARSTALPSPALPTTLTIGATAVLNRGESLRTNRTRLVMESGGDLAIYDENNVRRWASGTTGFGYRSVFQGDGNLVVYDQNSSGLWTSGTAGRNGAVLVLEADGNVCVVYQGQVIWASNTAR